VDIHKPKAVHGLREFASEIGVIVCGVLIALAGEQAVETLHWRHKIHQTEDALRLELVQDNAPQAYIRMATAPCLDQQLDRIATAVNGGQDRKAVAALIADFAPPNYSWDAEAWRVALASDVGSHTSANQMILWSAPYRVIPNLAEESQQEALALDALQLGDARPGALSDAQRDRVLRAVSALHRVNRHISGWSRIFLRSLLDLDMEVPADERRKDIDAARQRFGACVTMPDYRSKRLYDYADTIKAKPTPIVPK
jgi:hypothetical protein